jgi:hypothetical protein
MQILSLLDRMVSFEALTTTAGQRIKKLPHHFSERWLSERRLNALLDSAEPYAFPNLTFKEKAGRAE